MDILLSHRAHVKLKERLSNLHTITETQPSKPGDYIDVQPDYSILHHEQERCQQHIKFISTQFPSSNIILIADQDSLNSMKRTVLDAIDDYVVWLEDTQRSIDECLDMISTADSLETVSNLLRESPVPSFFFSKKDEKVWSCNSALESFLGIEEEELLNRGIDIIKTLAEFELSPPSTSRDSFEEKGWIRSRERGWIWTKISYTPIEFRGTVYYLVSMEDKSEEMMPSGGETKYEYALENIQDGVMVIRENRIVYGNRSVESILEQRVTGRKATDVLLDEEMFQEKDKIREVISEEYDRKRAEVTSRIFGRELQGIIKRVGGGSVVVIRDVSSLVTFYDRLKRIVRLLPNPVFVRSSDGDLIFSNEEAKDLLSPRGEQLPDDPPSQKVVDMNERRRGVEYKVVDGEKAFLVTKVPFELEEEDEATLTVVQDITEAEEAKMQMKKEKELLEGVIELLSHDLRNPLNIAIGYTSNLDDCCKETKREIEESHKRMNQMIEKTLQWVREGASEKYLEEVDGEKIAKDVWKSEFEDTEGVSLNSDEFELLIDKGSARRIFKNAFENSLHHGGENISKIEVGEIPESDYSFYIEDDGEGIQSKDKDELLRKGKTVSGSRTGFGIAMIRQAALSSHYEIEFKESSSGGLRIEFRKGLVQESTQLLV